VSKDGKVAAVERAAIAEEVASILRHDLRNKFASVRNAAFFIGRRVQKTDLWTSDPRIESFFKLMEQELIAADDMITSRLSLKHLFGQELGKFSLKDCLDRALSQAELPANIKVEANFADEAAIEADVNEVVLMMLCLLENCVEAMPGGGIISVSGSRLEDGKVSLKVADTGKGMTEEARAVLFRALTTSKPGHAGLGLCIVRRIAGRYGGTVEVPKSEQGTSIELTFEPKQAGAP
jgi:signal transduction histidine kinase